MQWIQVILLIHPLKYKFLSKIPVHLQVLLMAKRPLPISIATAESINIANASIVFVNTFIKINIQATLSINTTASFGIIFSLQSIPAMIKETDITVKALNDLKIS